MALRLIACVLLLEITSFLRETYKSLPKTQRSIFPVPPSGGHRGGHGDSRSSHVWHMDGGRSASQAVVVPLLGPMDSSSRRWSMAAQSVANASLASSTGVAHGTIAKQPSIPPETMTALVNNTHSNGGSDGRKISFVIQDDSESKTSSQTTLAMQVIIIKSACQTLILGEDGKKGGVGVVFTTPSSPNQSPFEGKVC